MNKVQRAAKVILSIVILDEVAEQVIIVLDHPKAFVLDLGVLLFKVLLELRVVLGISVDHNVLVKSVFL